MNSLLDLFIKHPSVTIDSRNINEGQIFFAIKGDNFDGHDFISNAFELGASYCVASDLKYKDYPSVIIVEDTLKALQDLARAYRKTFDIPFFGITGSNGKTTTKELLARVMATRFKTHMTKGNFNNHLGVPLTILAMPNDAEFAIIEMGANHIGEIRELCEICLPTHGLITNIGLAHLEGFGSAEGVKIGKSELMDHLSNQGGVQFINLREESLRFLSKSTENQILFGNENNESLILHDDQDNLNLGFIYKDKLYETQLFGAHNFNNILSAFEVGKYFGCDISEMIEAIVQYQPTNNRSQRYQLGDLTILLDAYNANPTSVHHAIQNFGTLVAERKSVILGDMLELGEASSDFHRKVLADLASLSGLNKVILVGAAFYQLRYEFPKYNFYETTIDASRHLDWKDFNGDTLLIKGSRGLKLESLLP